MICWKVALEILIKPFLWLRGGLIEKASLQCYRVAADYFTDCTGLCSS